MVPRMLPDWIGKVAAVVTLLLVALLSMPSDAATKKAAPKATGNPFDILNRAIGRAEAPSRRSKAIPRE